MQKLNNLPLHHIGFAVRSIKDSSIYFEAMGAKFFHTSYDKERNLNFEFAHLGGTMIELVAPRDLSLPCAVTNMIEKQACTPYHICLKARELEAELIRLKKMRFKQVGKVLVNDVYGYETKGVFLFSRGMGLVELIQECKTNE